MNPLEHVSMAELGELEPLEPLEGPATIPAPPLAAEDEETHGQECDRFL